MAQPERRTIALADVIVKHAPRGIAIQYGPGGYSVTGGTSTVACYNRAEDALQALAESCFGPGVLLDLGRSAKWRQARAEPADLPAGPHPRG